MSYRIEYDGLGGKYEIRNRDHGGKRWSPVMVCGLVLLGLTALWPEGKDRLLSFLIPGEDKLTLQAIRDLTDVLRGGGSLEDAVYAFCHCIIHGA